MNYSTSTDDEKREFNKMPRISSTRYPDESYDDWALRVRGERPVYDDAGNELISDRELGIVTLKKHKKQIINPRDRNGYVYLLAVPNTPGLYKIGRASNPDNRLRTFNVKIPFPVAYEHLIKSDDCYTLETMLHQLFASQRLEGEFFNLSMVDVSFIKSLSGS